jgi:Nitroreductase
MENFKEIVKMTRSFRRFDPTVRISEEELLEFVDSARLAASGTNKQYLRYRIVHTEKECDIVYDTLKWGGAFPDWDQPKNEAPSSYIVLLREKDLAPRVGIDDGLSTQIITLAATTKGYGTCILQNCAFKDLMANLAIDTDKYVFSLVIAIGKPIEEVVIDEGLVDGNTKYYRDENEVHHVPKRTLADVLVK